MASDQISIENIDDICDMLQTMAALGVPSKGLQSLDEMKARVRETLRGAERKCSWSAGEAFSVLSQAKEEDSRKRSELLKFFSKTSTYLDQMDDTVLSLLKHNMGDVKETVKSHQLKLRQREYFVLVAGETSAGKSSLLNLILGEELLPYSILSTTSTICELKYGEKRKLVAHFKDRDPETLLLTKVFSLTEPAEGSEDTYLDQISSYVHVKNERDKGSVFKKIELFWPHVLLQSGIVIVDSPGIGESEVMDEIVTNYLPEAFAFIYVINSANAGGIQKDRLEKLLEDVRKVSLEGHGKFLSKCALFVCNKWDQVPRKETDEVKEHVIKKLKQCWPSLDPDSQVIYMSTTNAHTAQAHGIVTDEFASLMTGISSMVLKSIEATLEMHWKWLDYLLARMIYQTRAFIQNAARERDSVIQKMRSIINRLNIIENQQGSVMEELNKDLKIMTDSAVDELARYLKSNDVQAKFTSWTLDDVPKVEASWEVTKNEILKALQSRLREVIEYWEEDRHVFAGARESLVQQFLQQYNFVEGQLRNLESSVAADDIPDQDGGSRSVDEVNLTTAGKAIIGVTSPIWVPLGLVALVIGVPVVGILAIKEKLEGRSKTKKYEKDKCGFMAEASTVFLKDMADESSLQPYVKDQLKEAQLCLKQIEGRIPELIHSDKLLCQQLRDETRSQREIQNQYSPLMNKSLSLRGDLAMFGIKEVRAVEICSADLEWKYEASSRLGSGSFAAVYRGRMKRDGGKQMVALKVWQQALDASNSSLFLAEAETLRRLVHPHIVKYHGTALLKEANSIRAVLVMELCKTNLRSHIFEDAENVSGRSENPAAERNVVRWACQITNALSFIHRQGIVHRDLKLDNILLSDEDLVKISDVGVSKEINLITGTLAGSRLYIAPEVINAEVYDDKADIYSFGIMLWEMWYGKRAFAFCCAVDQGKRPSHVKGCKIPPRPWEQLMKQCWAENPEERPTAQQCCKELNALLKAVNPL